MFTVGKAHQLLHDTFEKFLQNLVSISKTKRNTQENQKHATSNDLRLHDTRLSEWLLGTKTATVKNTH